MSKPEALRRARRIYEELRMTRDTFTVCDFHDRLRQACEEDLKESALDGLVTWAREAVDKEAKAKAENSDLQQKELFDYEGVLSLGEGRRVGKEFAKHEHIRAALAIRKANLDAVRIAYDRANQEYELVKTYYENRPGITFREATEMYLADHPEAAGGSAA